MKDRRSVPRSNYGDEFQERTNATICPFIPSELAAYFLFVQGVTELILRIEPDVPFNRLRQDSHSPTKDTAERRKASRTKTILGDNRVMKRQHSTEGQEKPNVVIH